MSLNVKGIGDAELLKEKFKDFIYSLSLKVLLPPSRCLFGVACTWQMIQHKLYCQSPVPLPHRAYNNLNKSR